MQAMSEMPKPEVLEAIAALQRLAELFIERRERLARSVGLTVEQWRVLQEIGGEGFMPSLFARERQCSPAAVSKTIRQLLDKGAIAVEVSAHDGRQRSYRLTPTGRALLARLNRARQRAIRAVWQDLPPGQLKQFSDFSGELARRLEAYSAQEMQAERYTNARRATPNGHALRSRKA
ncbi:MAG: MarR family transcriptional regulator [Candidatus Hydrogenedentota bacterium]|jgi:DNA-binding MarR family transcriptional regulator|nr:MAG: MarR family transcriptional regulator [Candidatus Hydrogenedentota bacterium]